MGINKILKNVSVSKSCEYWDIRVEETYITEINYDDFELIGCSQKPSLGAFIRVYHNGFWFYSSTTDVKNLSSELEGLIVHAETSNMISNSEVIKPYNEKASEHHYIKSENIRMDKVLVDEKKKVCEDYFGAVKCFKNLKSVKVRYLDKYRVKYFRSSKDVKFSYDFNHCGISIEYTVSDGKGQFNDKVKLYGKEINDLKNKNEYIKEGIKESELFINAKNIDAGTYPVVMDSEVVGVFAHESFGHKSEADFMIGDEKAKETWKLGIKVGNECLSIVDEGVQYGTGGYCPIDDEGFPTQKTYLIKDGILTGRLHSQQTSQLLDEAPTGNGRAINFEYEPIVRMTNTYVEAGDKSLDELIAGVDFGIYCKDFIHGSGLSTFTIAPKKCYLIKNGKITDPVRVSVISGSVFETLDKVVGCSKDAGLFSSVFGGCGKMNQAPLHVGFGGPKVLISELLVS